jgi:hypothetical protein
MFDGTLSNVVDLWARPRFRERPLRIDDEILKCVAFLGLHTEASSMDDVDADWRGTAFFVSILSHDKRCADVYLVTAKHNVDKIAGREFIIGMNLKENRGLAYVNGDSGAKWWFHPETPNEVDIAIMPFGPPDVVDMATVPIEGSFLSPADIPSERIGPGDEVFAVGLFTKMTGKARLIPIVRTGNIAMMPAEKIPGIKISDKWTGEIEAYLIEARSIGGLSGSPCFVRQTVHHKTVDGKTGETLKVLHGLGKQFLLGLVHGHWEIRASERNEARIKALQRGLYEDQVNLGIAVVIPCQKIVDVLNHPELKAMRVENEKRFADDGTTQSDAPTPAPQ